MFRKKLYRIDEVQEILGYACEKSVRRMIVRRELEALKIGGSLRVTGRSLSAYVERQILKFNEQNGDPEI